MSTRRSARSQAEPSSTNSSSSAHSGRAERSTRSNHKVISPQKSSTPPSPFSGDGEIRTRPARRAKREDTKTSKANDKAEEPDNGDDEGEVTRCICGHQDYPGPPKMLAESGRGNHSREHQAQSAASDSQSEEAGSLFIQCDVCKVWQHGGCVGIFSDEMSPENYFCEACKKDLHQVKIGAKGQKYSLYLPVSTVFANKSHRKALVTKDLEHNPSRITRESRSSVESISAKRRSTMNSRAAYDEEEMVRRVIEESKGDSTGSGARNGNKKGKRSRDNSEESKESTKRARTDSGSPLSPFQLNSHSLEANSDDEAQAGRVTTQVTSGKGPKNNTAQAQREKEQRERETERERERAEAAGRRKGRAERRRAEDAAADAAIAPSKEKANRESEVPRSSQPQTDTPPPAVSTTSTAQFKKTGRPPARRGRVGRNQYTRDKYPPAHAAMPDPSPQRSQSRNLLEKDEAIGTGDVTVNGSGSGSGECSEAGAAISASVRGGTAGKPSKPKHLNINRTSMNEMRRRVTGILEFLSRTQIEMATATAASRDGGGGLGAEGAVKVVLQSVSVSLGMGIVAGVAGAEEKGKEAAREFGDMSMVEMMDLLTRDLVVWQREYGKVGER